jgi:2,4-dienoyl-CoA reductase-like NADH-dependent reductase (Old Yellow Enzyme family)/ribulose 1,5-bisphosphate synthetase/thiazole synthase
MSNECPSPGSGQRPSFDALFAPGRIGSLKLKNRVLMAPMEKNLCTADGVVTQRYIDYLVERARADVALLRVEATYVDPIGKGRPFQLGAHSDHVIPALSRLVAAVHAAGGLISLELAHCGRQTNSIITGRQPVAPSAVPCLASGGYMPRPLTASEIGDIVERFAAAAGRAQAAGVDAIEIHGASGYLINAFTSPYTNLRDDDYGGTTEKRRRFALEVVAAVKRAVGADMPLLYRMSADDFVPGGITTAESGPLAAELERAGVQLVDVSAGTYESILITQPPMESDPGQLLSLAAAIKRHVTIPVATAGKLVHLEVAERALAAGEVDFVTIGRGLHADPELLTKARSGRVDEIRRCIACAECVAFLGQHQPAYCAINPTTIRERVLRPRRAAIRKRVLVVGGGPAGLEAARAATLRGHSVRLFERSETLGGQARFGALSSGRQDFAEPIHFLERELERLGVRVSRGVDVDAATVEQVSPDVAILATGAAVVTPPVPGRELPHVIDASAYLASEEAARRDHELAGQHDALLGAQSVAVVGGDWVGCHVASLLLERGLRVSIIETQDRLAHDMGEQPGAVLRERVVNHPGTAGVYLETTVEKIAPGQISLWHAPAGRAATIAADAVVLGQQRQPNQELAAALAESFGVRVPIRQIGDCVNPRKLQDALLEGATVAASL